jgi:predicted Zn finger-like uncharacterized protein
MKVQCGQCPAKYAIADERIHGKKVRIRCKRCGSAIVVDGKVDPPHVTTEAAPQGDSDSLPPPSPRPEAKTILGGLEAPTHLFDRKAPPSPLPRLQPSAARAGMPAPGRGFTEPPPAFDGKASWRVAMTENDLRWMTTAEVLEAYRMGVVKPETFVLGEGMSHWQTLLEVSELAGALGYEASPPPLNGKREEAPSVPPPRRPSTGKRPAAMLDPEDGANLNARMTKLGLGLDLKPRAPSPLDSVVEPDVVHGKPPARLDESFLTLPFTDAEAIESLPPAAAPRVGVPEFKAPPAPAALFATAQQAAPPPAAMPPPAPPVVLAPMPDQLQQSELPAFAHAKAASSGSLWPWLLAVVVVAAVVAAAVVFTR